MLGFRDNFAYILSAKKAEGKFIPYLYIKKNTIHIPLLFRLDIDLLPHSFVMLQYDQTYLNTDTGFSSFILKDLHIEYSDGTFVNCIEPSLRIEQRTFAVTNKGNYEYKQHFFNSVITKRMDFKVFTIGTAIKKNGEVVPFKRITQYKYDGKKTTFHTIFDEWASV